MLSDDRQMRAASFHQPLPAGLREARIGAAGVVLAGAALQQLLALQAVDQPRQPAARELRLLGQVAHAHAPAARVLQMIQHLIGGHRQVVRLLELRVQALGKAGVRAQQGPPGALDGLRLVPLAAVPC